MKKHILLMIACATMALCHAQNATLKGKVAGFDQYPIGIILNEINNNKMVPIDTFYTNKKGSYTYSLPSKNGKVYLLSFANLEHSSILHLMVLPGEKITLDMEYKPLDNYMVLTRIGGSDNMKVYQRFNAALYRTLSGMRVMETEFNDSTTTTERKVELQQQYRQLNIKQSQDIRKLIDDNSNVPISAFLVTYFDQDFATHADLYEKVRDALIERFPSHSYVQYIDNRVKSSLKEGSLAPEIALCNGNGDTLRLSDLRGKVVLVDFWASWCRPCRMENPNVVRLYNKYKDKGFDIFSVSLDNEKRAWQNAIRQDGLSWPHHVSDLAGWQSKAATTYGITSIPATVLIDKQGRIVAKNLRGEELEQKLSEMLGD